MGIAQIIPTKKFGGDKWTGQICYAYHTHLLGNNILEQLALFSSLVMCIIYVSCECPELVSYINM
jgi:hypothetical protein